MDNLVQNVEWSDDSLLEEIVIKEYGKQGKDPTKSLKLLEEQDLKKLKRLEKNFLMYKNKSFHLVLQIY